MIKRILIGLVGFAVISGGAYLLNPKSRNCNDLVDLSNAAVDAFNKAQTKEQVLALPATLEKQAAEMRTSAGDYKQPIKDDAVKAATDLEAMSAAIKSADEKAISAATDTYNADVHKVNGHCKG